MKLATSVSNARLQKIIDAADAGGGPATLKVYAGTVPASADDGLTTQTLLVSFTLATPSFAAPAARAMSAAGLPRTATAGATGVPTFARLLDVANNTVGQLTAGTAGSGAEVTLNTAEISEGADVELVALSISEPEEC